jgi:hypothetical protein
MARGGACTFRFPAFKHQPLQRIEIDLDRQMLVTTSRSQIKVWSLRGEVKSVYSLDAQSQVRGLRGERGERREGREIEEGRGMKEHRRGGRGISHTAPLPPLPAFALRSRRWSCWRVAPSSAP